MHTKEPLHIFAIIFFLFWVIHFSVNLIKLNYGLCHFIYGFGAPYLLGYAPIKLFKWHGLKKLPINYGYSFGWYWSIWPALILVSLSSVINEIIDDPEQNGTPFIEAWHHFALNHLGLAVFVVFYVIFLKGRFKNA